MRGSSNPGKQLLAEHGVEDHRHDEEREPAHAPVKKAAPRSEPRNSPKSLAECVRRFSASARPTIYRTLDGMRPAPPAPKRPFAHLR
jgi:hypothetical protein